jgi:hypothetical protein
MAVMSNRGLAVALAVFAAVVFAQFAVASGQGSSVLIGILEDNPGHYSGDPHYRDVRVVFRSDGTHWIAFPSNCLNQKCLKSIAAQFPHRVEWTVTFRGQEIGHVLSQTPAVFDFYSTVGQQNIVGTAEPPTIGAPSADFAGFIGEPVYRPLVAISQSHYRDRETWQTTQLSPELASAIREAFRKRFPHVTNCTKQDIEHAVPWRYSDANIRIPGAYASNRRWLIAEVALTGYQCDGPSDEPFSYQWFVVTPKQQVRFLGSGMWFVDAGDYGGDGKTELVFSIGGYNRDGYKLLYDDFKQSAVFEFTYH